MCTQGGRLANAFAKAVHGLDDGHPIKAALQVAAIAPNIRALKVAFTPSLQADLQGYTARLQAALTHDNTPETAKRPRTYATALVTTADVDEAVADAIKQKNKARISGLRLVRR